MLDEVDAALDNVNVTRVANYIRRHATDVQYVVISLKRSFFERSNTLVGIYRDQDVNSSRTVTLDVRHHFLSRVAQLTLALANSLRSIVFKMQDTAGALM